MNYKIKTSLVLVLFFILGVYSHSHGESEKFQYEFGQKLYNQIKEFYQQNLESRYSQVIFSIFLVSFPSVPTFFFLVLIQSCYNKNYAFSPSLLNKMISFSVGTLLGDVLLHMMPHLFLEDSHSHDHHHDHHHHGNDHGHDHGHDHHDHSHGDIKIPILMIGGIMGFLILDFVFMKLNGGHSHGHDHSHDHNNNNQKKEKKKGGEKKEQKKDNAAFTFLIGDMLHNVTDGLAIGAAFSNSLGMGLTTTFVIIIHELPHEMGDFAYLIKKNFGLFDILKTQILTSFGALVGGIIGIYAGEIYKTELLSITAGGFLYMCLSQILPDVRESHAKSKSIGDLIGTLVFMSLGVLSMYYITLIE